MNLQKPGGEHTIDVDMLSENPIVLDVGCRGFEFDRDILKLRPKAKIIALDPDPSIEEPSEESILFLRAAMTHRSDSHVLWQGPGDGGYIVDGSGDPEYRWGICDDAKVAVAPNITIEQLMASYAKDGFDLVKLDCESSEFGVLENWGGSWATQLSIEFHDAMDRKRWNDAYFERLFSGPLRDYDVKLFGLTPMGPGNTLGHWDSLLVLR